MYFLFRNKYKKISKRIISKYKNIAHFPLLTENEFNFHKHLCIFYLEINIEKNNFKI